MATSSVVRRQEHAQPGDIVVALVDGEATVKRFGRDGHAVILKPEHPTMAPIVVRPGEHEVRILGKVLGLVQDAEHAPPRRPPDPRPHRPYRALRPRRPRHARPRRRAACFHPRPQQETSSAQCRGLAVAEWLAAAAAMGATLGTLALWGLALYLLAA